MHFEKSIFWLAFAVYWSHGCGADVNQNQVPLEETRSRNGAEEEDAKSTYSVLSRSISQAVNQETCNNADAACFSVEANDKLGLEAIMALHHQLDDDRNGNIDISETDDFLREELKYDSGYEKRQQAFHRNDDMHISVKELWEAWLRSEVHNWTVDQTLEWLACSVDLPQYVNSFKQFKVSGALLPRLAVNNMQLLSVLGIKDPIHKQKIALKAMDAVLFGPPKGEPHSHWKDLTLIILLISGGIGLWYAVQQNKKFKKHLNRMNKDMEGLQSAELALQNLQKELEQALLAQENVATEKQNLEKKLQEAASTENRALPNSYSDVEVSQLKAEIEMLRNELQIAEGELKDRCWAPPIGLQQWLQLTHEIENKSYVKNKLGAERQLQQAREACEKLRKKRSSLVGAFVSTHGKSIDDVDRSIVEARTSLNEVTHELQERMHRWKQIEMLCGFNVINNPGLQHLENTMYRNPNVNGKSMFALRGRMSSQDDLDDETSSVYAHTTGYVESGGLHGWKEADSSGSEASKQDDEPPTVDRRSNASGVHFIVGGEVTPIDESPPPLVPPKYQRFSSQPPSIRSISNNNILASSIKSSHMVRSQSQDINMGVPDSSTLGQPKPSQSDGSLDRAAKPTSLRHATIKEQPSVSMEDDLCSTDSSLLEEDIKKKKRKIFAFAKKGKSRGGD